MFSKSIRQITNVMFPLGEMSRGNVKWALQGIASFFMSVDENHV